MNQDTSNILLDVKNLCTEFSTDVGPVRAVDNVSFKLEKGKVLGIVGESGCGKTVSSLSILRLLPNSAHIVNGEILFNGKDLLNLSADEMRRIRGNRIALIPQDPFTSLNPLYTVGNQILEVLELHQKVSKAEAMQIALESLAHVKIPNPERVIRAYPHELSGGMRQRVIIAMALVCKPELLIADEPTTALDVTVQAQILNLIKSIQEEEGMSLLLITHDLGVVAETCHNVAVMYAGQVVEYSDVHNIFENPLHPYTQGLLNSLPSGEKKKLAQVEGQPPTLLDLPQGCLFEPRCSKSIPDCKKISPELLDIEANQVRCILYDDAHKEHRDR